MGMIKRLNRTMHPYKSKGLIEEVISNVVRSKSPVDKLGTVSTHSTDENYLSILDRYNSMKKELDATNMKHRQT